MPQSIGVVRPNVMITIIPYANAKMVRMTRRSVVGHTRTMDLPVCVDALQRFLDNPRADLIQRVFPHLTPSQREFILTGMTDEDWRAWTTPCSD